MANELNIINGFISNSNSTVNGLLTTFGLSSTTISASSIIIGSTIINGIDVYVTGGTYNSGTITFTNNTGGTFTVNGISSGSGGGDTITGGTYDNSTGTLYLRSTANTITITGFTTGITNNNNNIILTNNTGGTISTLFNTVTGLTANIISATTISANTLNINGSNLNNITTSFTGTTIIDFDSQISGETTYTSTAITNSNITSYSNVIIRVLPSTNHPDIEDSMIDNLSFTQSDIVDGVGFTLNAFASEGTWGIYNIFYKIIN